MGQVREERELLSHRKSMWEGRQSSLLDLNNERERFQAGLVPRHHYKEPGAYPDDFRSWLFPKPQGMEPGEKELSALAIWSISPNEVDCLRKPKQTLF